MADSHLGGVQRPVAVLDVVSWPTSVPLVHRVRSRQQTNATNTFFFIQNDPKEQDIHTVSTTLSV